MMDLCVLLLLAGALNQSSNQGSSQPASGHRSAL
jgi:hypothetical protein